MFLFNRERFNMSKIRNSKASKKHNKNSAQKVQEILGVKDLAYSSIYSISSFCISLLTFIIASFCKESISNVYIIFFVSLVTFLLCWIFIKVISEKNAKTNGKHIKVLLIAADIGTNIGYLTPILLMFSAVSEITKNRLFCIMLLIVVAFLLLSAVYPVRKKYKTANDNFKNNLENCNSLTRETQYRIFCPILIVLFILIIFVVNCAGLHNISLCIDESIILTIRKIIYNDYVVNILCTIITAAVLYFLQIKYSKYKLRLDFRCNEIMEDLYDGIKYAHKIKTEAEKIVFDYSDNLDYHEKTILKSKKYYELFVKNKYDFYLSHLILTYPNNDILIDSIQSVFFINLNFKLLNIVNNIKNRKPNLEREYPKIESLFEKYKDEQQENDLISLGFEIKNYITDVGFMGQYCFELLNYLGYDQVIMRIYRKVINSMYSYENDLITLMNLPEKEQKKIKRKVAVEYIKYKVLQLFYKK